MQCFPLILRIRLPVNTFVVVFLEKVFFVKVMSHMDTCCKFSLKNIKLLLRMQAELVDVQSINLSIIPPNMI